MKLFPIASLFIFVSTLAFSQVKSVAELNSNYINWHNKDFASDNIVGTSVDKVYRELLVNKQPKKEVIVAVIDSGVDIFHEDLVGKIWINPGEIPGNNIDDDKNGYVDDIHGWNFIGNSKGENVYYENLEYTRLVKAGEQNNPQYESAITAFETELNKRIKEKENLDNFTSKYNSAKSIVKKATGVEVKSAEDVINLTSTNQQAQAAIKFLKDRYAVGFTEDILKNLLKNNREYLDYFLNPDYDGRKIVGDDPVNFEDRFYGNPDVKGPRSDHGTSVTGVIAAIRDNGLGIDGICSSVKIMVIRSTPRGDERDKDVALGIIYAVDNGANIINMSFGKDYSPNKLFVDQAVKYAEEKGVLIVHGSGNGGKNIDIDESFPSDRYQDGTESANWLNVGANNMNLDTEIAAVFSNYGDKHVDIFAPGVNIVSTDSSSTYSMHDGTSLSAPVVTGVAALLLSYYPTLTPNEIIDILLSSSFKFKKPGKVLIPTLTTDKREKVDFSELSKSDGIVNAYNAFLEAEKRSKKTD